MNEFEDSIRAAMTVEEARSRVQQALTSLLAPRSIRVSRKRTPESEWACRQSQALVLPARAGCRVFFPLSPEEFLDVRLPAEPGEVEGVVRATLDRLVGVLASVTRTIRERSQLEYGRHLLDGILDSIPLAILAADRSGRILITNPNAEILFGFRRIDVIDEPIEAAVPAFRELFEAVRGTQRVQEREIEHETGGAKLQIGITASPLGFAGTRPFGVVFVCRDLRVSREIQKLRELDALKTDFVHHVSHELKTPLTAMLGSLDLLRMEKDSFTPAQAELLDVVFQGARRLGALVTEILAVSRLEHGSVQLSLSSVRMEELVRELVARLPERGRIRFEPGKGSFLARADRGKASEILENLVSNALKYSREPVDISLRRIDGFVRIEVSDRGIGIRPRDRQRIFEKFFRSEDAVVRSREGTGLGLTITRELVLLHGGRISFRSKPGRGTTFTVDLPGEGARDQAP